MNTHPTVMRANSGANQVKCCATCLGHSMSHRTNNFMNAPRVFYKRRVLPSAQAAGSMVHMSKTGKHPGLFPPQDASNGGVNANRTREAGKKWHFWNPRHGIAAVFSSI
jgi:hypothetical protein